MSELSEPLEADAGYVGDARNPPNEMIQLSIAISLKRIADALWGTPATTGIVQLLGFIEQGRRYE